MGEFRDKYHVMFDNMAQGAFYQLADGSLVDVNAAALAMFGLSRDEFIGRTSQHPLWRVVARDGTDLPGDRHPSMVALSTGQPVRDFVAGVFNEEKQDFIWLNINAIPMFREGETAPYQVFVTMHDFSEQKRNNDIHLSRIHLMQFAYSHSLHEVLVEALNRLESLTCSVVSFYHFYDEEAECVLLKAWSTRTVAEFCRIRKEGRGSHYSLDHAGLWVDCVRKREVVVHNDVLSLPNRRGWPDGHAPVCREVLVPVMRNGQIVAIVGMGNKPSDYTDVDVSIVSTFADLTWDIVERKRTEASLLQAKRELQTLTNTSMDGYWITSSEGRIIYANETCCQMHGFTMEEMLAKSLRDIDVVEDDREVAAHIALIKERGYDRFEARHHHKDGGIIDVEVNTAYLKESDAILGFIRDITAQKQMQAELLQGREELQRTNQLLEERVSERTAELRAAIQEQESFSYSVSHDLRAPLRHINSFSAILMEEFGEKLPGDAHQYLQRMRTASDRMGALIDHLLLLSRVGRAEIKPIKVDLSRIASAVLRMLQETDPHREVRHAVAPGLTAYGDRHLLSQLLGNLLENAWKYTSKKKDCHIEFGMEILSGEPTYFVKDNGAGFDNTYQQNLFKPFARLHGAEFEGIGIGLATAQRIVRRHGGKIWGEGELDNGATFYFTLPRPMGGRRSQKVR